MTLQDHYATLPEPSRPKTNFVNLLAKECRVSIRAAMSWVRGERTPSREYWPIIEQLTGIPAAELFPTLSDEQND